MSIATFVEATSADPYVRELHRRAMRVLNDSSLDRAQREEQIRHIQRALLLHQSDVAAKAAKAAAKKVLRAQSERANCAPGLAHPSQILNRRRELCVVAETSAKPATTATPVAFVVPVTAEPKPEASSDQLMPVRKHPLLTLKKRV